MARRDAVQNVKYLLAQGAKVENFKHGLARATGVAVEEIEQIIADLGSGPDICEAEGAEFRRIEASRHGYPNSLNLYDEE